MGTTLTLVDLAGAVSLLLWGVHMVQTGIQRAYGAGLRRVLGVALGSRAKAFAAGLGTTAVLQSSTATGLMVSSFAAAGLVDLVPALAAMLGANLGTTLIVQVLSFDVSRVASLGLLAGVLMFRRGGATRTRDLGRVLIGLGLMLLALRQLLDLVTPYEDLPSLRLLMDGIATEPVIAVLLAAALTWAAHSSVAVVLLVMALAAKGVVPPGAAFALVLGANLGTAINPLLEGAAGEDGAGRRLAVGNLVNRLVGIGLALAALGWIGPWLVTVQPDPARAVADFHTGFNLVMALLFLPLLGPVAALLRRWMPTRDDPADPSRPLYLQDAAREAPTVALAGAAREALRMADALDGMLGDAWDALARGDRDKGADIRRSSDMLDRLGTAIRSYVTALDPEDLSDSDHHRLAQILAFTTNLEHAGDVLDRNVVALAVRSLKRGIPVPPGDMAALSRVFDRLRANLRTAAAVFMTGDVGAARALGAEKTAFRDLEAQAATAHLAGLRQGRPDEEGRLLLEALRDLKRINTHLVAAAAYPVLAADGALLPSRLRGEHGRV